MLLRLRLQLFSALIAAAAVAAACSSSSPAADPGGDDDDDDDTTADASSTPPADSGLSVLHLSPSREFSGFDGTHTFKVPIAVYGAKDPSAVKLTADDPASATITPVKLKNVDPSADSGIYFMVEIKKSGTIALTAKAGSQEPATASIDAAAYDAARWTQGETRYMNPGSNGDPACRSCHVDGQAIDHSPATLASVADTDVGRIMTLGVKPSRATISTGCTDCSDNAKKHIWTLTDDERRGLIVYLRGLEPRGFQ